MYTVKQTPGKDSVDLYTVKQTPGKDSVDLYTVKQAPGKDSVDLYTVKQTPGKDSVDLYTVIIIIINLFYIVQFDTNGILTALYIVITYIQMQYVHVCT